MLAWATASELPQLTLADALELLLLASEFEPSRFDRGLVRWHSRLCGESQLSAAEAGLSFAALSALKSAAAVDAAEALAGICERHGLEREARVLADSIDARSS